MAKATKIHEESLSQLATNGIEENDLYSITDYPVGGLTQQQMLNALTVAQEGFYQINSVYMCVDTGVNYLQNHFYRFNGSSWVDVTPEFAGEIKTKTLAEMESEVIDEDTLYNIVDYPIGGITQQQMLDALEPEQLGFYQVGSVYLCTDTGNNYVQNHFYKFTYDALQDEYSWVDTHAGADIDDALSTISTNPVENRVVTNALNDKVSLTADEIIYGEKTFTETPKLGVSRLPAEFTEVEYIQTDGNQYVNTGANPSQARVLYDFEFTGGARQFIYGWYSSSSNMVYFPHKDSDGQLAIRYASTAQQFGVATNNYRYNVDATIYPGNIKIILNGSQIYSSSSSFTQTTRTLWLFCSNDSSDGAYLKSQVKLYSSKIYDGDTLVRDFIPCYTNQSVTNNGTTYTSGTIGLYDLVNNIFYVNNGTGTFTKGNDVLTQVDFAMITDVDTKVGLTGNETIAGIKTFESRPKLGQVRLPTEFTEVEYIQTDGNQYIGLGYNSTQAITNEVEIEFTNLSTRQTFLGVFNGQSIYPLEIFDNSGYKFDYRLSSNNRIYSSVVPQLNTKYKISTTINTTAQSMYINNSLVASSNESVTLNNSQNYYLFAVNTNVTPNPNYYCYCKLYSYKAYDSSNTLIRDFVPCYTNQSVTNNGVTYNANTIGLYDIVNNIFYVNSGTGDFLKGNDVLVGEEFAIVSEIPEIEANNQSATTATLTKLSIDGVNYAISGGGSGSTVTFRDWSST